MPSSGEWLIIAAIAAISAVLVAVAQSRGWRAVFPVDLRFVVLIPAALTVGAVADHVIRTGDHDAVAARLKGAVVLAIALGFGWVNRRRIHKGWTSLALLGTVAGVAANAFATLVRGGMPVVASSARRAGFDTAEPLAPGYVWAEPAGAVDWLFGDSIPIRSLAAVISVGDVLLMIGFGPLLVWFLVGVFAPRPSASPYGRPMRGGVT